MNKYMLPICALVAAITVMLGALGAHALKGILQPTQLASFFICWVCSSPEYSAYIIATFLFDG
jgi:uncharacterized membrane protein YgdD (TMEM256/DUF423 family)